MMRLLAAVALVSATVYTGEGPPLEGATIVIDGTRIAAVGREVVVPNGAEVLDVGGAVVTPGLIDAATRLGVSDVRMEKTAVEATLGKDADPVRAALRVADSFNPHSFVIPVARAGGLTSAVVLPSGGLISGQAIWIDLVDEEPIRNASAALLVSVSRHAQDEGGRARFYLRLREVLEDARLFRANRGPYITRKLRQLSISAADLEVLRRALDRELLVLFEVDRAADIRTVLGIIREHRLRAALLGAAEAWMVADEIAAVDIPVLMDPIDNLPSSFDRLQIRSDGALRLYRAGVRVAFTKRGASHFAHRLRWVAGNAVADGFPYEAAMAAITSVPAEIFGMAGSGSVKAGALANLVVWNGDPFEVTTWPTHVFIRGRSIPPRSRQDLLTERYLGE